MARTLAARLNPGAKAHRPNLIARSFFAGWILAASLFCGYVLVPQPHTFPLVVACDTVPTPPSCSP